MNTCRTCTHYRAPARCGKYARTEPDRPAVDCPEFALPDGEPGTCASCRHWPGPGVICPQAHRHACGSVRACTWWRPRRYLFRVSTANVIAADAPEAVQIGAGKARKRVPLARFKREPARERLQ